MSYQTLMHMFRVVGEVGFFLGFCFGGVLIKGNARWV